MKKVIIIGGGVAGISAGIYALQNGYEAEIYEKNPMLGGECTGWERQGYHIDNCIHWLTDAERDSELNKVWRNVGAVGDGVKLYREEYFYKSELDGVTLHLWSDLEKARAEFLAVAPEDTEEINKFFDSVRRAECVRVPSEKSMAEMGFMEYMKFGMTMAEMGKVMMEYGKQSVRDLAARFNNKHVRQAIGGYLCGDYMANTLISSYAFYTSGTAAIPEGGSVGMIKRMAERFESLGGKVHTGMTAVKINIKRKTAESVTFSDGKSETVMSCDYIICACDPDVTFTKLLDKKYMDKTLAKLYAKREGYIITSGFGVFFGVKGEESCGALSGSAIFPCEPYKAGVQTLDMLGARLYDYDPTLFPADRRVIQVNILQYEKDYEYWKELYSDKAKYNAEKERIAADVEARIEKQYPELAGRLITLCTYSPMTFTKWCGAYMGGYMSFFEQKGYKSMTAKNGVRGIDNVFIASQWNTTNGGLPTAVTQGRFAVQKMKNEK